MKEFKFNAMEEKMFFGDNLLGAAKVVNTANTIQGIIYNNIFSLDQALTDIGVGAMINTPILYKNLHGMDIDTSLLDGYIYSNTSTVDILTVNKEEIKIDYMLAMEFSTIPYQETPGLEDQQQIKDDSLALSLRIAMPQGALAWCKENQVNPYSIYGQIAGHLAKDLSKDLMAVYMQDNSIHEYKFNGSIGSEG